MLSMSSGSRFDPFITGRQMGKIVKVSTSRNPISGECFLDLCQDNYCCNTRLWFVGRWRNQR